MMVIILAHNMRSEFDERLVRRLIEKIAVFPDNFTVEFKSEFI